MLFVAGAYSQNGTHTGPGSFPRAYHWQRLTVPDLSGQKNQATWESSSVSRAPHRRQPHTAARNTPTHQHISTTRPDTADVPTKPSGLANVCARVRVRADAPARAPESHYTGVTALIALRASTGMTRFTCRAVEWRLVAVHSIFHTELHSTPHPRRGVIRAHARARARAHTHTHTHTTASQCHAMPLGITRAHTLKHTHTHTHTQSSTDTHLSGDASGAAGRPVDEDDEEDKPDGGVGAGTQVHVVSNRAHRLRG